MLRISALVLLLFAAYVSAAFAQEAAEVATGSRVRVFLVPERGGDRFDPQELRGTVTSIEGDTLTLQVHSSLGATRVPIGWIDRMEVSLGRGTPLDGAREGAIRGLVMGVGLGAVVGAEVASQTEESFFRAVVVRMVTYGASIGATSALVGLFTPAEQWRQVPVSRESLARPATAPIGIGVTLSF